MSLAMERHGDETTVEQELVSWRPASSSGRARRGQSGATNTTKRKSMLNPTNKQDEMTGPVGTHGCCVLACVLPMSQFVDDARPSRGFF